VIDCFADHYVHVHFLPSNNSIRDQPNDNGTNASLKACITEAFEEWRAQVPIGNLNKPWFNSILVKAWEQFENKNPQNLERIIKDSFAKTNIFPMINLRKIIEEEEEEGTSQFANFSHYVYHSYFLRHCKAIGFWRGKCDVVDSHGCFW
jgi:hypothetical protein